MDALSRIHARVLRVMDCDDLIMLIKPRHELEELSAHYISYLTLIRFLNGLMETIVDIPVVETTNSSLDPEAIHQNGIIADTRSITGYMLVCPNLKEMHLCIGIISRRGQERVRELSMTMMERRWLAGCPLSHCHVLWSSSAKLVVTTSTEGITARE